MHLEKHVILGVHITDRVKHADEVQKVFTRHGCQIRTRLGLHDASGDYCSPNGLILLEVLTVEDADRMAGELNALEGVEAKQMVFEHP